MPDWEPEPRPIPDGLEDDYVAPTHPPTPTRFADWTTQLEGADFDTLKAWANGGAGDPDNPDIIRGTD